MHMLTKLDVNIHCITINMLALLAPVVVLISLSLLSPRIPARDVILISLLVAALNFPSRNLTLLSLLVVIFSLPTNVLVLPALALVVFYFPLMAVFILLAVVGFLLILLLGAFGMLGEAKHF